MPRKLYTEAQLHAAVLAERERIAAALHTEGDNSPCHEDGCVYHGAAWLVRGDFSYDEAERLQITA